MKFVPNVSSCGAQFFVITQKNLILNTKYLYYLFYELIINYLGWPIFESNESNVWDVFN